MCQIRVNLRRWACLLAALACLLALLPLPAHAAGAASKVVRVGWYEDAYNITGKNGERSGHYARYKFTVTDNGIGMSEAFQKHIYESFSRAENSVTNKVQGTGLGMAITKNIVDMMGGVITLQSQLGKGTRFEVVLDFKICEETVQAAPAVCPAPAQDSPSLHGMRFLCSASATNRLRSSRNNRQHKSPAAENQAAGLSVCSPVRQGPAGSLQSRPG